MTAKTSNFTDAIFAHAKAHPRGVALADQHTSLTWKQTADLIARASVWLDGQGIGGGDPVGVRMSNCIDHVILSLALMRVGAAKVEFQASDTGGVFDGILDALHIGTLFIEPSAPPAGKRRCVVVGPDWRDELKRHKGDCRHADDFEPHDLLLQLDGVGATGILLPHARLMRRLADDEAGMAELEPYAKYARSALVPASGISDAGFLYPVLHRLALGGKVFVIPESAPLDDLVRAASAQKNALLMLTPAMCEALVSFAPEGGILFPKALVIVSTGEPLAAGARRQMLARVTPNLIEIHGGFASGPVSVLCAEDISAHADSVGRPFPRVEVQVVDADGREVGAGITGHLRTRGKGRLPHLAAGKPFGEHRDGWFYPGDMAMLDEGGYLHLRGRASEVIRRRGVDVVPGAVEVALKSHPGVEDAAVIGLTRAGLSDIVAVIQPHGTPDAQAFHSHCIDRVGAGQAPGGYLFIKQFPRTPGGRIDRARLKARVAREVAGGAAPRPTA